jgi:glycerophosphoryl diester phosphodiesterase
VVGGQLENTLGSFRAAVEAGLRWVEADARINADDALVSLHDAATGDGRFVAQLSSAETDELGLMRVADLLADLPPHVGVNVEVKSSLEDALRPRERTTAALVAELVERSAAGRPLLVSSFDPAAILIFREHLPEVPVGLITWTRFPLRKAIPAAVHLGVQVVAAHFGSFPLDEDSSQAAVERAPAESVRVAHEAGLQVATWCPKPPQAAQLAAAGVDCLIVDDAPAASLARRGLEAAH